MSYMKQTLQDLCEANSLFRQGANGDQYAADDVDYVFYCISLNKYS